jgi:hypothetical protein
MKEEDIEKLVRVIEKMDGDRKTIIMALLYAFDLGQKTPKEETGDALRTKHQTK